MKICVLQPDYSASSVDYRHYDPTRDLSALLPGHTVDHVALNKLTTYRQLKALSTQGYDIFMNLCEGYLDWDIPSVDVIETLERLKLPFTGPTAKLYDPFKTLMKYVAYTAGVRTPPHLLVTDAGNLDVGVADLRYPLFVKPAHAGDSLGIDAHSLVHDAAELRAQVDATLRDFAEVLVEEYIAGREFTVLVLAGAEREGEATALTPFEFVFPAGTGFKTYALKTSELHPEANVPVRDEALAARLKVAALRVFRAFGGVGYARLDFRLDERGELFFLEVNFTCSVFYQGGYEGSADYILKHDSLGQAGFAAHIIAEGLARYRRARRPHVMRGNGVSGYGIFAATELAPGDVVFRGEGRAHRIVTARHVQATWNADDQLMLRRYGYPLSDGLYAFWDDDPDAWAPQNHSCRANTGFDGLNVVALRAIASGEELTLDYTEYMNEDSEPFACRCGAANCQGMVTGRAGNSVTARESARHANS
jgi:D-alanine-D-alanine ligase